MKLSVCLATYNEELNLAGCLESVKAIADEIVIVDGGSSDKTVEIAKKYNARVIVTDNPSMFHINKQKALDACLGKWILQLDADERLSSQLSEEINKVIRMSNDELDKYERTLSNRNLFLRHQELIEEEQGKVGTGKGDYTAFFLPRSNYFLGKYLRYGGVYPDGAIRLFKKGKAHFPCRDVHEVVKVDGKVGWLQNDLLHYDSPTFKRYIERNNRYINMMAQELKNQHVQKEALFAFDWIVIKPISWFFMTQIRHKGILDGWQGIVFSLFSALRFPRAYLKYLLS